MTVTRISYRSRSYFPNTDLNIFNNLTRTLGTVKKMGTSDIMYILHLSLTRYRHTVLKLNFKLSTGKNNLVFEKIDNNNTLSIK